MEKAENEALNDIFSALAALTAAFNRYDERSAVQKQEVIYTAASGKAIGEALASVVAAALNLQWRAVVHDQQALKAARVDAGFQQFLQSQCIEIEPPENVKPTGKSNGGRA